MSYLVDTNVLVRLTQKNSQMRPVARRALINLRKAKEDLIIIPQNLIEFWAVATRPVINNGLGLSVGEASKEIAKLKRLLKLLPDNSRIFTEWELLVVRYQVIGKPTHDARLVAAMLVHGISNILTFNIADFKRFCLNNSN